MARQFILQWTPGDSWCQLEDGRTLVPVLREGPAKNPDGIRLRDRPGDESGSGPYFNAYKKRGENGIAAYYQKADYLYSDACDNTTRQWGVDDGYGKTMWRYHETYSNGHIAYHILYACSYAYSQARYVEIISVSWCRFDSFREHNTSMPVCNGRLERMDDKHLHPYYQAARPVMFDTYLQMAHDFIYNAQYHLGSMRFNSYIVNYYDELHRVEAPEPHFEFKYAEHETFLWNNLTGGLSHHCTSLATAAYIDAADNLPGATANSIATVIEAMEAIAGICKGKPPRTPKGIKDLWLSYRYAVCTTKADIEEYAETTRRLMTLANASAITSNGSADDGKIRCTCTISVNPSCCIPSTARDWLRSYGFRLSALNAWDMVPFSFVVDWFLHIGDILEMFENMGDAFALPVDDMWYSFRTNYDGQDTYFRVPGRVYFALPYVSYHETSNKTICKRILDSIALFT